MAIDLVGIDLVIPSLIHAYDSGTTRRASAFSTHKAPEQNLSYNEAGPLIVPPGNSFLPYRYQEYIALSQRAYFS